MAEVRSERPCEAAPARRTRWAVVLAAGTVGALAALAAARLRGVEGAAAWALASAGLAWAALVGWLRSLDPAARLAGAHEALCGGEVLVRGADEAGAVVRAVALRRRVRRLQAPARRVVEEAADEAADAVFESLAHELRTPLNALLGFTSLLESGVDGPLQPAQREAVEAMLGAARRLADLVDEVVALAARAEATVPVSVQRVDAARLVRAAARELRGLAPPTVTLRVELLEARLAAEADPVRLMQVLVNLGANALQVTREGEVVLAGRYEGDRVVLEVRDSGPGIADPERLLRPFEQGREGAGGIGLGLAIVRHLVARQGGRLRATSVSGRGTTWAVSLRRAATEAATEGEP